MRTCWKEEEEDFIHKEEEEDFIHMYTRTCWKEEEEDFIHVKSRPFPQRPKDRVCNFTALLLIYEDRKDHV